MNINFSIEKVSNTLDGKIKNKIDSLTKPPGSLGKLEELALQVARVQDTLEPKLSNPTIVVFAGDHGAAKEGISPFPQEVTYQMVLNFLNNGAGINVFCTQNEIDIKVVDAGVNFDFKDTQKLINKKISFGTKNYLQEPAMTKEECLQAINNGSKIVNEIANLGCNVIGFGEMGIGNTSSASLIMSKLLNIPINECVGKGAGHNDEGIKKKNELLSRAIKLHSDVESPLEILQCFGGFEIAMILGGMLKAAENKMLILVDGFIATSAFLIANALYANINDYAIFCHNSNEQAHKKMLEYLNANPLLDLRLRLGEGTGAAIAYPIIEAAVNMINKMATFQSAKISGKND